MRALLDTNILIHREGPVVVRENIGLVFNWLDRLRYDKCVHPVSAEEIARHKDQRVRNSFAAKVASYNMLKTVAPMAAEVQGLSDALDATTNDRNDSKIVNELFVDRVDILITEDRGVIRKAEKLGIGDRVFTIDAFLEKVVAENPGLIDYKVLSVKKSLFGEINLADTFFDSFRQDYPGFDRWFNRKSDEPAYVCLEGSQLAAFLYLKMEDQRESYPDIFPPFRPKRRLKIGSFRVELNGFKLESAFSRSSSTTLSSRESTKSM